ncbi:MAG: cytochrome c [Methylomicrobium sp.]|nr:cytochrome c [Methylomicrobium sp.]
MPKNSIIIALSLASALAGCVSQEQRHSPKLTRTDHQAVLHVVTGTKLRNSIHRLNNLMLERNITEPELDKQGQQVNTLVLEVATGAEIMLDCLLDVESTLNFDSHQHKQFHALADDLRDEANTLKNQVQSHQLTELPATLEKMNVTCISCHELFRHPTVRPTD